MLRITDLSPRRNWRELIASEGLIYAETTTPEGQVLDYWNENTAYVFTPEEVTTLENVTENLHRMALEAARFLANEALLYPSSPFAALGIPREALEYADVSLRRGDPDLYGRFDLIYENEHTPAKMLEYNADTPTGIVEAAVSQWSWYEGQLAARGLTRDTGVSATEARLGLDQWNSLFDALIERFAALKRASADEYPMYFVHSELEESGEDILNTAVLRDAAIHGGWDTVGLLASDLVQGQDCGKLVAGYNGTSSGEIIHHLFKLYPWEDLVWEEIEANSPFLTRHKPEGILEPAWKMLLSNKMLSAAMWYLYPGHENLLETYPEALFTDARAAAMRNYVKKPLHGREGDDIVFVTPDHNLPQHKNSGRYGEEGYVYQAFHALPDFVSPTGAHNHPVLGTWVVNGESVGVGIRESDGQLTDYYCRFVPNLIAVNDASASENQKKESR